MNCKFFSVGQRKTDKSYCTWNLQYCATFQWNQSPAEFSGACTFCPGKSHLHKTGLKVMIDFVGDKQGSYFRRRIPGKNYPRILQNSVPVSRLAISLFSEQSEQSSNIYISVEMLTAGLRSDDFSLVCPMISNSLATIWYYIGQKAGCKYFKINQPSIKDIPFPSHLMQKYSPLSHPLPHSLAPVPVGLEERARFTFDK